MVVPVWLTNSIAEGYSKSVRENSQFSSHGDLLIHWNCAKMKGRCWYEACAVQLGGEREIDLAKGRDYETANCLRRFEMRGLST